jgi:probable HAF family extracellular repeat protein
VRPTGLFGSEFSTTVAVSADGSTVVGTFQSPRGEEAFRWVGDSPFEGLGALPGGPVESHAFGVSADGSVVVGTSQPDSRPTAFRWTADDGIMDLEGDELAARAVSADGVVVVGSLNIGGNTLGPAYRWTAQTGSMPLPPIPRPGFAGAEVRAVTADGSIVVGYDLFREGMTLLRTEAFRWTEQHGTLGLNSGGWVDTVALDVSGDGGVIVGGGLHPVTKAGAAFYWTAETGMHSLRDVLLVGGATGLDDWRLVSAEGISEDGLTIVGTAIGPNGQEGFVATIPEPSTSILAALAAIILFALYLRHRFVAGGQAAMTGAPARH